VFDKGLHYTEGYTAVKSILFLSTSIGLQSVSLSYSSSSSVIVISVLKFLKNKLFYTNDTNVDGADKND